MLQSANVWTGVCLAVWEGRELINEVLFADGVVRNYKHTSPTALCPVPVGGADHWDLPQGPIDLLRRQLSHFSVLSSDGLENLLPGPVRSRVAAWDDA